MVPLTERRLNPTEILGCSAAKARSTLKVNKPRKLGLILGGFNWFVQARYTTGEQSQRPVIGLAVVDGNIEEQLGHPKFPWKLISPIASNDTRSAHTGDVVESSINEFRSHCGECWGPESCARGGETALYLPSHTTPTHRAFKVPSPLFLARFLRELLLPSLYFSPALLDLLIFNSQVDSVFQDKLLFGSTLASLGRSYRSFP